MELPDRRFRIEGIATIYFSWKSRLVLTLENKLKNQTIFSVKTNAESGSGGAGPGVFGLSKDIKAQADS